jgi:dTDP-glucose 4,6-dehydratase
MGDSVSAIRHLNHERGRRRLPSKFSKLLVTGGAGFIGSNFVRFALEQELAEEVLVLDALTYSGNKATLAQFSGNPRFSFTEGDICDPEVVERCVSECDAVLNFAAETHVDRSLFEAANFIRTNVHGTWVLLEAVRNRGDIRMVQASTDEVYGAVLTGSSVETDTLHPRNPYSASKAGAEMMAIAYAETYGTDVVITRGSNTYGPFQYPEKFIPLMITNIIQGLEIPVYGDGLQVRHWIHVDDHCSGIAKALIDGVPGEFYNVGADVERTNLSVAQDVVRLLGASEDLITHVRDRPGHDRRYSLSSSKLRALGWEPQWTFEDGIVATVEWYQSNEYWWRSIRDGEFDAYYRTNYAHRSTGGDDGNDKGTISCQ